MSDRNGSECLMSYGRSTYLCAPELKRFHNPDQRRLSNASRALDIKELEKDSENLSKKAKKRLSQDANSAQSLVQKLIHWQRKRKLDKIITLLDNLFPKLKSTEKDVHRWLDSVHERKELLHNRGKALICDLEHQISTHQHNLDFLDEVINDINKLDYDIVNEMAEVKAAYQFNQVRMQHQTRPACSLAIWPFGRELSVHAAMRVLP
jgi:hypothetical protein